MPVLAISDSAALIRRTACVLGLLAPATACGDGEPVPAVAAVVLRDSAGIRIVENTGPEWPADSGWTIGESPRVTIGLVDGEEPYLLDRVAGAVLNRDGLIVIANSGTAELRFFDGSGRHIRTVGGQGGGPGEYRRPSHLMIGQGDTLLVWDAGISSVTFLEPDGTFIRRDPLEARRMLDVIGWDYATEGLTPLPDGSFVLHAQPRGNPHELGTPPGVIFRPPVGFFRFSPDLARIDSLGWYGGLPQMYLMIDGQAAYATTLVTTHARVAGGGDPLVIYAGNGDPYQIEMFDGAGDLKRIIRRLTPPIPIPDSARQRLLAGRENWRDDPYGFRARMRRVEAAMPVQTYYPAYSFLFADRLGYLWVSGPVEPPSVFTPDGRWLGRVDLPGRLLDIGLNHALVVTVDTLGIERVHLYDLLRR
jgi:hypothetical protein